MKTSKVIIPRNYDERNKYNDRMTTKLINYCVKVSFSDGYKGACKTISEKRKNFLDTIQNTVYVVIEE